MYFSPNSMNDTKIKNLGFIRTLNQDAAVRSTSLVLFIAVCFFIILDIFIRLIFAQGDHVPYIYKLISVGRDDSFSERFMHGVLFSSAVIFLTAAASNKSRVCLSLAAFSAIAWYDDSAQYHERFGYEFAKLFPRVDLFGLGSSHIGELIGFLTLGVVFLILSLWSSKSIRPGDMAVVKLSYIPVIIFIACASIIDLVHSFLSETIFDAPLMYLEDGGEMIAIVMLTAVSLYVLRNSKNIFSNRPTL